MKFRLLHPRQISDALWQEFADLRDAQPLYDDPFFDPDFARLVADVREDTRIGIVEQGSDLLGFWALHERAGGWARPIGGPFSDWHAPVLRSGTDLCPGDFLRGLDLSGFTGFGFMPTLECTYPTMQRTGAHIADLSMGWEAYLATQQTYWPKHFKKMRRVYRKVEREFSEYSFAFDDKNEAHFEDLIQTKRAQYTQTGLHDVLKAEWARALLDRLRHFQGARLSARLSTLKFEGNIAASEFNLQSDTMLHGWLVTYKPGYSAYSPGHLVLHELFPSLVNAGLKAYDLGPGQASYKRNYTNLQLPIETGVIQGASSALSPIRAFGTMWRGGEKYFPNSVAHAMGRLRRRTDQIVLAEPELEGRLKGLWFAVQNRGL